MKKFLELPIDKLVLADWNYKDDDESLMQLLINNIKKNGLIENILVRELGDKYEVVNGNHRVEALRRLKHKKVMCFNLGNISLVEAKRISIETNETEFEADKEKYNTMLSEVLDEFGRDDLEETLFIASQEILSNDDSSDLSNRKAPEIVNEESNLMKIEFSIEKKVMNEFTLYLAGLCQQTGIDVDNLGLDYTEPVNLLIDKLSGA